MPDYRGLFVRGLDYKRTPGEIHPYIDPDGARNLDGEIQEDEIRSHAHTFTTYMGNGDNNNPNQINTTDETTIGTTGFSTNSAGGAETRPKNIVALYCIKW